MGVRSGRGGVRAAVAAGVLGVGLLVNSAASPASAQVVPDNPDVDELNASIRDFAKELLDTHAEAVATALENLETAQAELEAATLEAEQARAAADAAADTARRVVQALEATQRAERAASHELAELTRQVAQTRDRLGAAARAAYQSGGGLAGWSGTVVRGGDQALRDLNAQLARLDAIRDQVRHLRARYGQLRQRATATQAAAVASEEAAKAAESALEAAEAAHAEASAAAEAARAEEHQKYDEFLAESKALEAWLAEYSPDETLKGTGTFVRPGTGPVTSPFGPRLHPILGYVRTHPGVDIGRGDGFIYAADHGVVAEATWNDAYGYMVIVDHGVIDGQRVSTLYAHQPGLSVMVGDRVEKGQPIGSVGSTGLSTGPHLHFEVRISGRPVNPRPWIADAPLPPDVTD